MPVRCGVVLACFPPLEQTEIMVFSDGATLPPAPTPTPAPTDGTTTPTTGELRAVGLLPLASTSVATRDPFNVRPTHALKVRLRLATIVVAAVLV